MNLNLFSTNTSDLVVIWMVVIVRAEECQTGGPSSEEVETETPTDICQHQVLKIIDSDRKSSCLTILLPHLSDATLDSPSIHPSHRDPSVSLRSLRSIIWSLGRLFLI